MSRIKEFFKSQTYPALSLALTVIGLIFFYAGRMNWIFIELTLGYEGLLHLIFPVLIFNAVLLCVLTLLRQKNLSKQSSRLHRFPPPPQMPAARMPIHTAPIGAAQ